MRCCEVEGEDGYLHAAGREKHVVRVAHQGPLQRNSEVPNIDIKIVHTPNPPSGAGQMATPLIAPAISNAVAAATGVRLRHMPMTPERVLAALG